MFHGKHSIFTFNKKWNVWSKMSQLQQYTSQMTTVTYLRLIVCRRRIEGWSSVQGYTYCRPGWPDLGPITHRLTTVNDLFILIQPMRAEKSKWTRIILIDILTSLSEFGTSTATADGQHGLQKLLSEFKNMGFKSSQTKIRRYKSYPPSIKWQLLLSFPLQIELLVIIICNSS